VEANLESFGVRFGVRANRPEILAMLADFLPPIRAAARRHSQDRMYSLISSTAACSGAEMHRLYVDSRLRSRSSDPLDLFDEVEGDLQIHLGEMTRRFVFLHAGVVAWNGMGIVLPGRSFCGKTTLVAALVRAGATYYSDEFAVLDETGAIHPYPRRLSLREQGSARAVRRSIESLGGHAGSAPIRPRLVLLTHYCCGAVWTPRPVAPAAAIFDLVRNSLSIRRQPGPVLNVLGELVREAVVLRGVRGDADETATRILQFQNSQ
jgi:hypothetical protein